MTLLYLLRHGEIEWPEEDCFIGQTDAPLSAQGRRQARVWNHELRSLELTGIWSSDLQRATEIAIADTGIIPLHFQVNLWAARDGIVYTPRLDEQTHAHRMKPKG